MMEELQERQLKKSLSCVDEREKYRKNLENSSSESSESESNLDQFDLSTDSIFQHYQGNVRRLSEYA